MDKYTEDYLQNYILLILRDHLEPLTVDEICSDIEDDFSEKQVRNSLHNLLSAYKVTKDGNQRFDLATDYIE